MRRRLLCLALASPAVVVGWGLFSRITLGSPGEPTPSGDKPGWTTAVEPKPLSPATSRKGLGWLAEHQLPAGGWGQGEESAQMGGGAAPAGHAQRRRHLHRRAGLDPLGQHAHEGPYKDAIAKAVRFVRSQVEASDAQSLSVTSVQGTRVQQKLGPNIDTFLASILLAEVKGRMPDDAAKKGVDVALDKVLDKIKRAPEGRRHVRRRSGWAPILAQAMCGKGMNRAAQAGAEVSESVLARAEENAREAAVRRPRRAGHGPQPIGGGDRRSRAGLGRRDGQGRRRGRGRRRGARASSSTRGPPSLGVLQDSVNTARPRRRSCATRPRMPQGCRRSATEAKKQLGEIADAREGPGRKPRPRSSTGSTTSSSSPASAPTAARSSSAT